MKQFPAPASIPAASIPAAAAAAAAAPPPPPPACAAAQLFIRLLLLLLFPFIFIFPVTWDLEKESISSRYEHSLTFSFFCGVVGGDPG